MRVRPVLAAAAAAPVLLAAVAGTAGPSAAAPATAEHTVRAEAVRPAAAPDPLRAVLLEGADKVSVQWVGDQTGSPDRDWSTGGNYHYRILPTPGKDTSDVGWKLRLTLPEGQILAQEYEQDSVVQDGSSVTITPKDGYRRNVPAAGLGIVLEWKADDRLIDAVPGDPKEAAPFAPYADAGLYPTPDLEALHQASGARQFTTAFIVADPQDGSVPVWSGQHSQPVSGNFLVPQINKLRRAGGDVVVSFGGASNQELALTIGDTDRLTAAYRGVVERLKATKLDFDIEGTAILDARANTRRAQALAALQREYDAKGQPLHISYTLPVMEDGLTAEGLAVVRDAVAQGLRIGTWNVMTMDYGHPVKDMGAAAISAGTALHDQLKPFHPGASDADLWKKVGITPMLGKNDQPEETFTIDDAARLTTWANEKHIGRLAMWQIQRDHPCASAKVELNCSSIPDQKDYGFSAEFGRFTG
ncbi:chitinase [Streptomyces luteireticuli]|uniref:chitinase n=1 Tax=Streptomyces luteireticuli TaxID=173858 RepID=UPI003559091A